MGLLFAGLIAPFIGLLFGVLCRYALLKVQRMKEGKLKRLLLFQIRKK